MKNTWKPKLSEAAVKKSVGFVYEITEKKTKKKYIGIKKFWTKKGKKTNWETYVSSSGKLKGMDINNPRKYSKKIVRLCDSITEMKCWEAWMQLEYYTSGRWNELFNEMINVRLRVRK